MALVGRIARPHGVRGQVIVNLDTDFPDERFRTGGELFVIRGGAVAGLRITSVRFHQGRPVVGIDGVNDMTSARALAGAELRVPRDWLSPLPQGTFYRHDLTGCEVQAADGTRIGTVTDVQGTLGGSRLVVQTSDGELLVPLAAAICTAIDLDAKRIVIEPPAGLLELNRR